VPLPGEGMASCRPFPHEVKTRGMKGYGGIMNGYGGGVWGV
jgi:hypothetical protein